MIYIHAMFEPVITIITVCRNVLKDLQRTFESVKSQTFSDYEYIIVDGASTDGTAEWLTKQQNCTWVSEPDKGIYDAMNKGVHMAHGQWIIFLNAGDTFFSHETLQETIPYLTPAYGLIYGDIVKLRHGELIVKKAEEPHNAHRMFFCHQALFTRKDLLQSTPFDITHTLSADFKFVKQMYKNNIPMLHAPIIIAHFDTTGASNQRVNKGLKDNIAVIKELDNFGERLRLIPRLRFKILWNKLRGKD